MNNTRIEWSDVTWNPITGCPKPLVSVGCQNCYARRMVETRFRGRFGYDAVDPFGIHVFEERFMQPVKAKKPLRIFVCSMGDLFHDLVTYYRIAQVFAVMAMCPQHTFYVLTKRPERMLHFLTNSISMNDARGSAYQVIASQAGLALDMDGLPWPLRNVFLGISVSNQDDLKKLVAPHHFVPGWKYFLSAEPLLGALAFEPCTGFGGCMGNLWDWIVCGGETGPHARAMHPDWVRSLRDQAKSAGVPFFFKSWGEWAANYTYDDAVSTPGAYVADTPFARIGKRRAGRLLDGKEYNEVPE